MIKKIVLVGLISMFYTMSLWAQNEKFKALFIYNYTKYIEWPAGQRDGDFVIGVLGSSSMADELKTVAQKQKVGARTIVVKVFTAPDNIENCHILYVASGKSTLLASVLQKLASKATLVITDKEGLAKQGAGINFVTDGSKLNYEINKSNIEKTGLSVSSSLLSLGIAVN